MATALRDLDGRDAVTQEVEDYLVASQHKSLLRFITCGSVDDGKSTLIGRLLFDSKMLFEDQLAALEADSRKSGTQNGALDFALLVDGLAAEREQGITIDVAYRFFSTDKRKFVVADTPGHEHYTRNMVTGASTAELAVILVDARKGVLSQTRRHSYIAHLLGIRNVVLAVNKMDLVGYDEARFDEIVSDYSAFAEDMGIESFAAIPVSGLAGDNIIAPSSPMPWYRGPTLLEHLEQVPVGEPPRGGDALRLPVQWVNRPDHNFRGYAGTIASGGIRPGDRVRILPSGQSSTVDRIVTFDGDIAQAMAGQAVTLALTEEVDCSRGDMIVSETAETRVTDQLGASLVWMVSEAMVPGRAYWLKIGTQTVAASVSKVNEVRDVNTMAKVPGRPLALNDIGRCEILLDRPVAAMAYRENRRLGGFVLIDRASHATVAAGMIETLALDSTPKTIVENGAGRIIWLTGRSSAQREDFARRARQRLLARGRPSFVLDASSIESGISSDLGDSDADQAESRRRSREVARLLSRAGVTVLVAMDVPLGEEKPGTELDVGAAETDWDWTI